MWQQLYSFAKRINSYDNKYFKWCLVTYLRPVDKNLTKIRKIGKDFAVKPDFKAIKFYFKIRDICKIEKKQCISISVFGHENRQKIPSTFQKILLRGMPIYY